MARNLTNYPLILALFVLLLSGTVASAPSTAIPKGTRLTAADEAGQVRAVKTVEVQGVQVAENAPALGIALEGLEAGQGVIWVLVNPQ